MSPDKDEGSPDARDKGSPVCNRQFRTPGRCFLLDLQEWGELWDDIYDGMIAKERSDEPRMKLEDFEDELRREGLLSE
jgi:hypothetical protein